MLKIKEALAEFKTKCTEASLPLRDWTPWFFTCALRRYRDSLHSVSKQRFCKHEFIVPLNRSLVVRHQNRLRWLVVRTLWGPQRSLAELLKTPSYPTTQPVGLLSQVAHSSHILTAMVNSCSRIGSLLSEFRVSLRLPSASEKHLDSVVLGPIEVINI